MGWVPQRSPIKKTGATTVIKVNSTGAPVGSGVPFHTQDAGTITTGTFADGRLPSRLQALAPYASNADEQQDSGNWSASILTANMPAASHWSCQTIHSGYDTTTGIYVVQFAHEMTTTSRSYRRTLTSLTWSPWQAIGPSAYVPTLTASTVAAETVVAQWTLGANTLAAGAFLEAQLMAQVSTTATVTYRARVGTTGTTTDAQAVLLNTSGAGTANAWNQVSFSLVVGGSGAAGTIGGAGLLVFNSTNSGMTAAAWAPPTVDLTVANKVSITVTQGAVQTLTPRGGKLEVTLP